MAAKAATDLCCAGDFLKVPDINNVDMLLVEEKKRKKTKKPKVGAAKRIQLSDSADNRAGTSESDSGSDISDAVGLELCEVRDYSISPEQEDAMEQALQDLIGDVSHPEPKKVESVTVSPHSDDSTVRMINGTQYIVPNTVNVTSNKSSAKSVSPAAAASAAPGTSNVAHGEDTEPRLANEAAFTLVTGRKKKKAQKPSEAQVEYQPKPRMHPALVKSRAKAANIALVRDPALVTILVKAPKGQDSLHRLPSRRLATAIKTLSPKPVAIRRIFGGGFAFDFPVGTNPAPLLELKTIGDIPIESRVPSSGRSNIGTVRVDRSVGGLEDVKEWYAFHTDNPEVLEIQRIGDSQSYKFLFAGDALPEKVDIFCKTYEVRAYFAHPIRCFKCQRYNHTSSSCEGKVVCRRCGLAGHSMETCKAASPRCVNCGKPHEASYKFCEHRLYELRVQKIRASQRCNFATARETAKLSYREAIAKRKQATFVTKRTSPNVSFADALRIKDSFSGKNVSPSPVTKRVVLTDGVRPPSESGISGKSGPRPSKIPLRSALSTNSGSSDRGGASAGKKAGSSTSASSGQSSNSQRKIDSSGKTERFSSSSRKQGNPGAPGSLTFVSQKRSERALSPLRKLPVFASQESDFPVLGESGAAVSVPTSSAGGPSGSGMASPSVTGRPSPAEQPATLSSVVSHSSPGSVGDADSDSGSEMYGSEDQFVSEDLVGSILNDIGDGLSPQTILERVLDYLGHPVSHHDA